MSPPPAYAVLESRALLRVAGADARDFLQGLISNDMNKVTPERAVYAAFLTPQGKYLHDFFVCRIGDAYHLDCEAARRDDLMRRLGRYRLRSKVEIDPADGLAVAALFGDGALAALDLPEEPGRGRAMDGGTVFTDPRLAAAGARAVLPREALDAALTGAGFTSAEAGAYDRLRLALGLPDGSRDLEVEKAILLENGFEELGGVDWDKGCFLGQEITARTHYRALIKKRLVPVEIDGPAPAPGTPVMLGAAEAGAMRSAADGLGLALLRLERLAEAETSGAKLTAGDATLTPRKPDWAAF